MRGPLLRYLAGACALGIILWTTVAWGQTVSDISQANTYYNQNQFKEAAETYERGIAEGGINGHLYYNLGNAYFRTGNLPLAILNYAKAQHYLPRDEDVSANLEYALRQTQDQLDGRLHPAGESFLFWSGNFNLKEHWAALLWINLAFWIFMAVRLHQKSQAGSSVRNVLLAMLILALVSTGFRWSQETRSPFGVIVPKQIDVHSGWKATTAALFQLHQGTLVTITREKENWVELELPDGKKGWIPPSDIIR